MEVQFEAITFQYTLLLLLGAELSAPFALNGCGSLASAPLLPNLRCTGGVFGLPRLLPMLFTCSGSIV